MNFDTLASPICKILFEIRKSKDRNVFFFQEPTLGSFRGINSYPPPYIAQHCTRLSIYSDLINLNVESVSNELLAIIKMKNIVKIVKLNLKNDLKAALGEISLSIQMDISQKMADELEMPRCQNLSLFVLFQSLEIFLH